MIQPTSIAAYNDKNRKKNAESHQFEILKIVKAILYQILQTHHLKL